jgi:hypothetical protein
MPLPQLFLTRTLKAIEFNNNSSLSPSAAAPGNLIARLVTLISNINTNPELLISSNINKNASTVDNNNYNMISNMNHDLSASILQLLKDSPPLIVVPLTCSLLFVSLFIGLWLRDLHLAELRELQSVEQMRRTVLRSGSRGSRITVDEEAGRSGGGGYGGGGGGVGGCFGCYGFGSCPAKFGWWTQITSCCLLFAGSEGLDTKLAHLWNLTSSVDVRIYGTALFMMLSKLVFGSMAYYGYGTVEGNASIRKIQVGLSVVLFYVGSLGVGYTLIEGK